MGKARLRTCGYKKPGCFTCGYKAEVSEKRRQFAEADRLVQAAKQNGLFVSKPELHSYGNRVNVISVKLLVRY